MKYKKRDEEWYKITWRDSQAMNFECIFISRTIGHLSRENNTNVCIENISPWPPCEMWSPWEGEWDELYCSGPGEIASLTTAGMLRMKHIFRKYAFSEHGHLSDVGDKVEKRLETTEIQIF